MFPFTPHTTLRLDLFWAVPFYGYYGKIPGFFNKRYKKLQKILSKCIELNTQDL